MKTKSKSSKAPDMKPAIKKLWIKALTSGKYVQGRGYLRIQQKNGKKRYCCLGVLTDLYCKAKKCSWEDATDQGFITTSLSKAVQVWAGVQNRDPLTSAIHPTYSTQQSLAELNDGRRWNFKKIAGQIEEDF